MDDLQKQKLKNLQKKYGYDISLHHDEISQHGLSDEDYYEVLRIYDFSQKLQDIMNEYLLESFTDDSGSASKPVLSLSLVLTSSINKLVNQFSQDDHEKTAILKEVFKHFINEQ